MAEVPSIGPKKGWKKVKRSYQPQGGARRGAAAVTMTQHGAASTNASAGAMVMETAIPRGIDPTKDFLVDMAIDEERPAIILWATKEASEGTTTATVYKQGSTTRVSFHVGGAFLEAPHLRPEVKKSRILVSMDTDEDGLPVVVIPVKSGKARNSGSRGDSEETPGSQAAPGTNS